MGPNHGIAIGTQKIDTGIRSRRMDFAMDIRVNDEFCDQLQTFGTLSAGHIHFLVLSHDWLHVR